VRTERTLIDLIRLFDTSTIPSFQRLYKSDRADKTRSEDRSRERTRGDGNGNDPGPKHGLSSALLSTWANEQVG
jgi:hypothetical protein